MSSKAHQFDLCLKEARKIVARYRSEAPEGCDPQNSELWVAALTTAAVGAGTAYYSGQQQKKAAEKASAGIPGVTTGPGGAPVNPNLNLPAYPNFIPADYAKINPGAVAADQSAYALSDIDRKRRAPWLQPAIRLAGERALQDQKGDATFMPQMQAESLTAGIRGALGAGGDGALLAPGSGAEANVAKHLGLDIAAFQDRNRANRMASLNQADALTPAREIGMGGQEYAGIALGNLAGVNAQSQAQHGEQVAGLQYNQRIASGNQATAVNQANIQAEAKAKADAARAQMYAAMASSVIQAGSSAAGAYSNRAPAAANAAPSLTATRGVPVTTTNWRPSAAGRVA